MGVQSEIVETAVGQAVAVVLYILYFRDETGFCKGRDGSVGA